MASRPRMPSPSITHIVSTTTSSGKYGACPALGRFNGSSRRVPVVNESMIGATISPDCQVGTGLSPSMICWISARYAASSRSRSAIDVNAMPQSLPQFESSVSTEGKNSATWRSPSTRGSGDSGSSVRGNSADASR